MRLLLDTHLLLWLSQLHTPPRGAHGFSELLEAQDNELWFSAASILEVAIKFARGRADFTLPPQVLQTALITAGYRELMVTADHAAAIASLPMRHGDPFDRLLIAQAIVEGLTLVTRDGEIARYPGPILRV